MKNSFCLVSILFALTACGPQTPSGRLSFEALPPYKDPSRSVEERVADLLARMSLDDKLAQMTQAEIGFIRPADLGELRLGSVLSGGDTIPSPGTAQAWADTYDEFQRAALNTPLGIPMLFATDAVHGHNYVHGATIFPHNLGLGATRDPELMERIGRATAIEMGGTGLDWTFGPCLAVARDDHWGRTYESFGEIPELPVAMTRMITGLQTTPFAASNSIMSTAKHYVGDGGTEGGDDQGQTNISEEELRAIHLAPFREAVARDVASVMVSYSSWNGTKMHTHRYLITDVLKGELQFSGIVITDWNGIELIDGSYGFSGDDVRTAVNAGIDLFMITDQYRNFISILRDEVHSGRVSMDRIDDATRRILRKKFSTGLFENPYTDRSLMQQVGSREHRELAREAVRKSLVVLKNQNSILPLPLESGKIFVAGKSADNIGFQSGGWTIQWQGGDGPITPGTSILEGIRQTVDPGTQITYEREGHGIDASYRFAIAVIGEKPYAEYEGDRTDELTLDTEDLALVARLKASGVPVIVVLVSGRPLVIKDQLHDWAALVAAWLPGSEGAGVADILFGRATPTGKLPVSWMLEASQQPINQGDGKPVLFPFGFGLTWP